MEDEIVFVQRPRKLAGTQIPRTTRLFWAVCPRKNCPRRDLRRIAFSRRTRAFALPFARQTSERNRSLRGSPGQNHRPWEACRAAFFSIGSAHFSSPYSKKA